MNKLDNTLPEMTETEKWLYGSRAQIFEDFLQQHKQRNKAIIGMTIFIGIAIIEFLIIILK